MIGMNKNPYYDERDENHYTFDRMATLIKSPQRSSEPMLFYEVPSYEAMDILNGNNSLEFYWCYAPVFDGNSDEQ